jgi:hypothetical protein
MLALLCAAMTLSFAFAQAATLVSISTDPFTNSTSRHKTEVEPDTFAYGSTIVSAFQVGRFSDGGSSDIGWATSTNAGKTWTHGFLPVTIYKGGSYNRASDPAVAYDAKHNVWLISMLAINNSASGLLVSVINSRSLDGGLTWNSTTTTAPYLSGTGYDKNWIVCDDTASSPYYGHCYTEWDDSAKGNLVLMSTSTNGGATWSSPKTNANSASVLAGQPLVQPNGTVVVPIDVLTNTTTTIGAYTSTNGGTSWSSTINISTIRYHNQAGNLRSGPLPSAELDGSGTIYVVWGDCRFETSCSADDLVYSTSTNGTSWSAVKRIPIDPVGSGVDHFIPGIAVDKATSGANAHLALTYYYYANTACTPSTCKLYVGTITSNNAGTSWSVKQTQAGPMSLTWLPNANGYMVGDYISTSFVQGKAYSVFAVAKAPSNKQLNEGMYTESGGIAITGGAVGASSDSIRTSRTDRVSTTAR